MSDYDWRHFDQHSTRQTGPPAEPDDPPPAAQHARPQEADTGPLPRADIAAAAELAESAEQQVGATAPSTSTASAARRRQLGIILVRGVISAAVTP